MEPDLYEILQVHPMAEPEVIDAAFRRLTRKYHPDINSSADAPEVMRRITTAYQILGDPDRRAAYDRDLAARRPPRGVASNDLGHEGRMEVSLLGGLAGVGTEWSKRSL